MAGLFLRDTTEVIHQVTVDTPTGGITKGDFVQVGSGSVYGFAFATASLDTTDRDNYAEQVTIVTKARQVKADKASGTGSKTFAVGESVYINPSTNLAVGSGGGAILVGHALEAVDETDTSVLIDFDGGLAL